MKIVALGDSLTVGEADFGPPDRHESTCYPEHLEYIARQWLSDRHLDITVNVVNRGVSGDLTSGMIDRFSQDIVDEKADYVIILGGTNDIGWGYDLSLIARNLTSMYDAAMKNGITPVACSVPSILGYDELIAPRLQLNQLIRTRAQARNIAFVDLFTATADPKSHRLLHDYSADGLHLNLKGYRAMGARVFDDWLRQILDRHK
jgi:acyl-CoA thioesterase-1